MATGWSSKLGASSIASTKTANQQEKRKQCAARAEHAKKKKQRPVQLINVTAAHPRGSGTAVPVPVPVAVPPQLHCAASSIMATAFPFPMAGVNGAAQLWSTAAMLGAASSRAATFTLSSLPAMASADGPAAAPFVLAPAPLGLQPPPDAGAAGSTAAAAGAALALPVASAATGTGIIRPPLVFAQQAGAAGELVPLPLHFVGYYHHTTGGVVSGLPTPAVGIPLAAALGKFENGALGRMLSALMPVCRPPLRLHQSKKTGAPPSWWPTGNEDWWAPELLAHLDTVAALTMHAHAPAPAPPVPFVPSYSLRKAQKVALLVAIVKHLAPDFGRITAAVRHSGKLSVSETGLWHSALNNERAKCLRPVFVLLPQTLPQQEQQQGGGGIAGAGTPSDAGTGSAVVPSGSAASDGSEKVAIANLPAGSCASVSAPAADGSRAEVTAAAAAVLVEKEPQRSDIDGDGGVVSAVDGPAAGDGGDQRPVNFLAGDGDGSTHKKQVAAAPGGHVRQVVAGGPEMTMQQPEQEQHGGVPGDDDVAAAAENDQVEVADVEEGHQWCYNSEELNRMFAEFESFGDDIWY